MKGFASPDGTSLLDVLSPRIARVFAAGRPDSVLYCKRVEPAHRTLPEATQLLLREDQILSSIALSSAAALAPRVIARGSDADGPYLLIASVEGRPLALPNTDTSSLRAWLGTLFGGLARLHGAHADGETLGLVHGDVSPENVVYTDTRAVFVDWELGRAAHVSELELGPFRGTLAFVAPEVAMGERASQTADVFSLGLVCLQLLAGAPIRKHEGAAGIVEAAESEIDVDRALARFPRDVTEKLRPFFAAVLSLSPAERPPDGGATLSLLW